MFGGSDKMIRFVGKYIRDELYFVSNVTLEKQTLFLS